MLPPTPPTIWDVDALLADLAAQEWAQRPVTQTYLRDAIASIRATGAPVVNAVSGGAVGNNIADDTSALQALLNTGANTVFLPPNKTFKTTSTLNFAFNGQRIVGAGDTSIINYTGAGVAISFNGKFYCGARDFKLQTSSGTVGIDLTFASHWWEISGCHVTGFSVAGVRGTSSYYGGMWHCDIETNAIGLQGASDFNANKIFANSFRQNLIGISMEDAVAGCSGTTIAGNGIESARVGTTYGLQIIGCISILVEANRMELTIGTAHIFVNSSASRTAQFTQLIANALEGTIPAFILGDGVGVSQVVGTKIDGGRAAGAMTINSDCLSTVFRAAPSSYPAALTDNGFGSDVDIDSTSGKTYKRTAASAAFGYKLTVGGSSTSIDTGATNDLTIKNPVGSHSVFETGGRFRVAQGSMTVAGDSAGLAGSTTTLSNGTNVAARSTGVGTILFADATNRNNGGFVKIYIGTTAWWVPIFAAG